MSLFGIIMVLLLVSRGVFVFPILAAHNYWSKEKLPFRQIVVAWCACLPATSSPPHSRTHAPENIDVLTGADIHAIKSKLPKWIWLDLSAS